MHRKNSLFLVLSCIGLLFIAQGCSSSNPPPAPADSSNQSTDELLPNTATSSASSSSGPLTEKFDDRNPEVLIITSSGSIHLRLYGEDAPLTSKNFLNYVHHRFYDNTVFHQVDRGHIILGGGRTADLQPKKTSLPVRSEADNGKKNLRGTVAMFRDTQDVDTATAEFFINLADNPHFDHQSATDSEAANNLPGAQIIVPETHGFTVFGEVIDGQDVLDKIAGVEVQDLDNFESVPTTPIVIQSIRRIR